MIILDTNVVSELIRPTPAPPVITWFAALHLPEIFLTSIGVAEMRLGLEMLLPGKRRDQLVRGVEGVFTEFEQRILPFDDASASAYAGLVSQRRRQGRSIAQLDAMIAAIVLTHGAILATRDADFADCGVEILDPWRT